MRKSPTQRRAATTVGSILEAAAQILQRDGEEKLTTNRIAERAGFSIGTVYQYFSNKEAIVTALADRERKLIVAAISDALRKAKPEDTDDVLRQIVRTLVGAFGRRQRVRKFIILSLLRGAQFKDAQRSADAVAQLLMAVVDARGPPGAPMLDAASAFVITRAILGTIRAAVLEDSPLLETPQFEDALVRLGRNFFRDG